MGLTIFYTIFSYISQFEVECEKYKRIFHEILSVNTSTSQIYGLSTFMRNSHQCESYNFSRYGQNTCPRTSKQTNNAWRKTLNDIS